MSAASLVERALSAKDLELSDSICVLAAGKAANAMASAAARVLGGRVRRGLVVSHVAGGVPAYFEAIRGSHPVPDAESERGGRRALEVAASIGSGESLLVLLSGGGSAILAVPADGVTLEDKRRTTSCLLKAGADIHALNSVRKHISAIKGGWLAATVGQGARCTTLAISDVVGDDLSVIASGPTVPDASTFHDAIAVIERYGGRAMYPTAVVRRLEAGARGDLPDTPKPGDARLTASDARVIGGRREAMLGAVHEAQSLGYAAAIIEAPVVGEARVAAVAHLDAAMARASALVLTACIVSSGETTVHVTGTGKGGRNQEFALAVADRLARSAAVVAVASVGTDGIDGPTDAAGAVVDSSTFTRALAAGVQPPEQFLSSNNAYEFFKPLGDLIVTGPTDTNVGDLQVVLIGI